MKKTIALFGATGQTGKLFLELAINNGYHVQALVRDAAKITEKSQQLHLIQGDVLNPADVQKTIENANLVVSLFGHVKNSPELLQTNGTQNIVDAMKQFGVARIISLSGGGLPFPDKDEPKFADKLIRMIMKIVVPKILNDAIAHHQVLQKSGLKWVVVRAARLTNETNETAYKVGWVGVNSSTKTSRINLAHFILRLLEDESYTNQMPFVSN